MKILTKPKSMDDCIYFTNRILINGKITAWVFRKECPKCKKSHLEKPLKKGKPDKKSPFYVCPNCSYQENNKDVEEGLTLNIEYTCPHCNNNGETTTQYQRKVFEGIPSYIFECQKCCKKISITKKLKEPKIKKQ